MFSSEHLLIYISDLQNHDEQLVRNNQGALYMIRADS
jgi:hypothetical protein